MPPAVALAQENPLFVRFLRAACLAALVSVWLTSSTFAHAELKTATPGPGDVVEDVPSQLVATFTQDLDAGRSSIELRDRAGRSLARGGRDASNVRTMRITLPALPPGAYTVRWTTFSTEDGELARATYSFVVAAASPAPTAPSASPPSATAPVPGSSPSPRPTASPSAVASASGVPQPSGDPSFSAAPSLAAPSIAPPTTPRSPLPAASPDPDGRSATAGDVLLPIATVGVLGVLAAIWITRRRSR